MKWNIGAYQTLGIDIGASQTEVVVSNACPLSMYREDVITGYHCFIGGYMTGKRFGCDPLKLPDGTVF